MAKKLSSLAGDFEGISKAADEKVLALLQQGGQESRTPVAPKPVADRPTTKSNADEQSVPSKNDSDTNGKPTKPKVPKQKKVEKWGKPISHFNTRIPEQMAELLDDLVYKLRKKGEHRTKQDLAREALHDLLRKHAIC